MTTNSVNSTAPKKGFFRTVGDTIVTQGKNMVVGGAVGLAAGSAVSAFAPVSRTQIAKKVVDHYVKTDEALKTVIESAENTQIKYANNLALTDFIKQIEEAAEDKLTVIAKKAKEIFTLIGEQMPNADAITKESLITPLKNYIENNKVSEEEAKTALDTINTVAKSLKDKALKQVEDFFKLARKNRSKDDIVVLAKKAAKKSQSGKIIGTAVGIGALVMMFSNLFSGIFPKKQVASKQAVQESASQSKVMTHQG